MNSDADVRVNPITTEQMEAAWDDLTQLQIPGPLMLACLSCGHIIRLKEWQGCRAEKKNDHCPIKPYAERKP